MCVCHVSCMCVVQTCVSIHVFCCRLQRRREADAFKPSGVQWYKRRASEMFASHFDSCENASSFYSCHVKWCQIKGFFIYFSLKVMPQSAVLQIHLNVFSTNETSLCLEPICFYGFQFSDRFYKIHCFESGWLISSAVWGGSL